MTIPQNYQDVAAVSIMFDSYNRVRTQTLDDATLLKKIATDLSALSLYSQIIPANVQIEISNILLQTLPADIVKQIS